MRLSKYSGKAQIGIWPPFKKVCTHSSQENASERQKPQPSLKFLRAIFLNIFKIEKKRE